MSVLGYREVVPRTFQHRLGESPTAERRFVVTMSTPNTPHQSVINSVGVGFGSAHPEYNFLRMTDASLSENNETPYHVEVVCKYELLKQEYEPNPLARPDVWSFSTGGAAVPATSFFDAGDKRKPLVNAVGDLFETATTEESEVRATISANRANFPLAIAAYVTNAVNNGPYLGGQQYCWKCAGIGAQQSVEMVNDVEVRYWQLTTELVYRASGWPLLLAHVGFNFLENGKKLRAFVIFRDEDGVETRVPSANAVALNGNGTMKAAGEQPDIISRRVHRAVDFSQYFGTPTL
jgi:hypothetical protein